MPFLGASLPIFTDMGLLRFYGETRKAKRLCFRNAALCTRNLYALRILVGNAQDDIHVSVKLNLAAVPAEKFNLDSCTLNSAALQCEIIAALQLGVAAKTCVIGHIFQRAGDCICADDNARL